MDVRMRSNLRCAALTAALRFVRLCVTVAVAVAAAGGGATRPGGRLRRG